MVHFIRVYLQVLQTRRGSIWFSVLLAVRQLLVACLFDVARWAFLSWLGLNRQVASQFHSLDLILVESLSLLTRRLHLAACQLLIIKREALRRRPRRPNTGVLSKLLYLLSKYCLTRLALCGRFELLPEHSLRLAELQV